MTAAAPTKAFPWDECAGFAFAALRLTPKDFWSMTPRELAMAMMPCGNAAAPMDRFSLNQLITLFPDGEHPWPATR